MALKFSTPLLVSIFLVFFYILSAVKLLDSAPHLENSPPTRDGPSISSAPPRPGRVRGTKLNDKIELGTRHAYTSLDANPTGSADDTPSFEATQSAGGLIPGEGDDDDDDNDGGSSDASLMATDDVYEQQLLNSLNEEDGSFASDTERNEKVMQDRRLACILA